MVLGLLIATGASLTASVLLVQVAVLPLLFKYNKSLQRKMIFANCFNYPKHLDYDNPSSVDIIGGRNFCIEFDSKVDNCPIKIGVWHMIPSSVFNEVFVIRDYNTADARLHNELKKANNTVVLYCHGNCNHRASQHRLQMYKVFQELNFHIIAFDYRGYGDSTPIRPTERGVVEDALAVYSWLLDCFDPKNKPTILLWGHSLGSAVAVSLMAHMSELCEQAGKECLPQPDALILESSFNNLSEEIAAHPFSKIVSWLPYFEETFVEPFRSNEEFTFTTDQYVTKIPQIPVLMLHSKWDRIVPHSLAVKLHDALVSSRGRGGAPVVFHTFDSCQRIGHNNLCEASDIKQTVTDFLALLPARKTTIVKKKL